MKKLLAIFMLLVFFFAACRKENNLLQTPTEGLVPIVPGEHVIATATISSWFAKNPIGAYISPDWTNARQAIVGGTPVVTVPIKSIYNAQIQSNNVKTQGLRTLSAEAIKTFDPAHAPALYFFKTGGPDSVKALLMNFIPDDPTKEYGQDNVWTGKLVEWNLQSDSANFQVLSKSYVKNRGRVKIGATVTDNGSTLKVNNIFADIWDALKWVVEAVGYFFGVPGDYNYFYTGSLGWCDFLWGMFCGGGGGGGSSSSGGGGYGGGGSYSGGGYYYDVVYGGYVNGYNGYGGGGWSPYGDGSGGADPCGGGGATPTVSSSNLKNQRLPAGPCDVVPPQQPPYDYEVDGPLMTDTYTDPETGQTIYFADVLAGFETHPQLIQLLEDDEQDLITDPDLPQIIATAALNNNPILTAMLITEAAHLKVMHPSWSSAKIWATAYWNTVKGVVHLSLDIAGLIPAIGEPADLINGAIYYLEGDHINCALSVASAVPVVGWVSTGGKWVKTMVTAMPVAAAVGKTAVKVIKAGKEIRFVKVSVEIFEHVSLKTAQLVKPGGTTLTNIGRTVIDKMGLRVASKEPAIVNKIDDIVQNGDNLGNKVEELSDMLFHRDGFVKHDAKFGSNNGFDGVYIKGDPAHPTEIIINEAKQMKPLGNVRVNPGNAATGLEVQMSDKWINENIRLLRESSDPALQALGNTLLNNRSIITKTVTTVDKTTKEAVILRLANY